MATRSLIAMVKEDKSVQVIYCHWDGYPTYVGLQLEFNYNNAKTIQELMDLGDRSLLKGSPTTEDTYAVSQSKEIKPLVFSSVDEFMTADKSGADYVYLWDGNWHVFEADYENNLTSLGSIDSIELKYA